MTPARLAIIGAYFGTVGYLIAKTGADKKVKELFYREHEKLARINARALVEEMATAKKLISSELLTETRVPK